MSIIKLIEYMYEVKLSANLYWLIVNLGKVQDCGIDINFGVQPCNPTTLQEFKMGWVVGNFDELYGEVTIDVGMHIFMF